MLCLHRHNKFELKFKQQKNEKNLSFIDAFFS
jgi:hypothetical protein